MKLSIALTKTTVNRHLLSNLLAINVRMIQIPFTVVYVIKETTQNKPLKHVTSLPIILYVIELHSIIAVQLSLPAQRKMLITTQTHFHHILSIRIQLTVPQIGQQVIKHILFVNFIQLQYVLPLIHTSTSLTIYCNPTFKVQCTEGHDQTLCPQLNPV